MPAGKKDRSDRNAKKGRGAELMAQMGMVDPNQMGAMMLGEGMDDEDDDDDLEAELAALQGHAPPPKKTARAKKAPVDMSMIEKMALDSTRDIKSDEEISGDEEDLMAELEGLSPDEEEPAPVIAPTKAPVIAPTTTPPEAKTAPPKATPVAKPAAPQGPGGMVGILMDRLENYKLASSNAKANSESSKARRYDRGIKTLAGLLKQAQAGKPINEEDIPPQVATGQAGGAPPQAPIEHTSGATAAPTIVESPPSHQPEAASQDTETLTLLTTRKEEYKQAAILAKKSGDDETAKKYLKIMKQFDAVIQAATAGNPIDLSQMPPSPGTATGKAPSPTPHRAERVSNQAAADKEPEMELPEPTEKEAQEIFGAPPAPKTVMEALEQRLQKYKSSEESAKAEGNSSKARRMGRIAKQYQDAIRAHKLGKAVDFEELPTPPGFAPIPTGSSGAPTTAPTLPPPQPQPKAAASSSPGGSTAPPTSRPVPQKSPSGASVKKRALSQNEQNVLLLETKMNQFKKAALEAKNKGEMEQAKAYLRSAKGFEPMIEAAKGGLPVDLSKCPTPPGPEGLEGFVMVEREDTEQPMGDRDQMYKKLETDLINQIRSCSTNSEHFTSLGDVTSAQRFEKLGKNSRKDLDALKNAYKHDDPVPRFHYEMRTFSMVQCCTELGGDDLELIIVRGLNYGLPPDIKATDLDTYVKFEFPYPTDKPQQDHSHTIKSTDNPEYDQTFKLQMNRKSRGFLRLLKSKSIKLEIYYKRGFFKGDKMLGTCNLKLQPLESQCVVHEILDLMDGRKTVGGKLEVKMRIREPFLSKQVEQVKEKWLVIDAFERKLAPPQQPRSRSRSPARESSREVVSMEVLRYEKDLVDKQIAKYRGILKPVQEQALRKKSEQYQKQIEQQTAILKQGGVNSLKAYMDDIARTATVYHQEAVKLAKEGQKDKAQIALTKKKCVENEVGLIQQKLSKM